MGIERVDKMDKLKEWVKDNRIIVGLVGVLGVLLIGLLIFNQVKTPMERGLEEDRDKTIALQKQKEVVQQEIQEQTGVVLDIPSKEAIRKEIDERFSDVYADSGYGIDYTGIDVLDWIGQTYGEDVKKIQIYGAYPDINLTREEQQALNIKLLDALGQGNYVSLDIAPLKVDVVSEIQHNAIVGNKTIGARYTRESSDDPQYVGDYLYYIGKDNESRIYLNEDLTTVDTGKLSVINPLVLRHNEESRVEGLGKPNVEIVYHVSPKEDMPLGQLLEEAGNLTFTMGSEQVSFNEQVGLDNLLGVYQDEGVDLTKLVSPLQTSVFKVYMPDTINTSLPYVELDIDGQTLVINQASVRQSVRMR